RGGRYNVGGFIKGGIFAVQATQDVNVALLGPAPILSAGSASDTQAAFVGEAGASASFQVTRYLSVSAGYQIIWLQGVALASNQVPVTGNVLPAVGTAITPTRIDVDGQVFYHGIQLGADLRF